MPSALKKALGSLSTRLLVPLLLTIAAVLAVSAWFNVRSIQDHLTALMRTDARRCAGLIERAAHDGMLLNRKDQVQSVIERLGQGPSVTAIRIYDMGGELTMSSHPREIGYSTDITDPRCVACHKMEPDPLPVSTVETATGSQQPSQEVLRHLSVIPNEPECAAEGCHLSPTEQSKLGVLEVEVSLQPMDELVARAKGQTAWTLSSLILITGLVAAGFVHRVVLRPVDRLHEGTERIAAGELDTRIHEADHHELGDLARAFNGMAGELAAARDELANWSRNLEQKVIEKTDELQHTQRQVVHMEKMASLGKLSATVAHELNNPISSMLTYARLIERELDANGGLDPEVREELRGYLRFLQQECTRCGTIVQNLLLFARRMGGTEMTPMDLNEVAERSVMLVRHHLEMSGIELDFRRLEGDPTVVADDGQIEQALVALMINAVEAMADGDARGGDLGLTLSGDDEAVEIVVSDTGVGIPKEVLPRIFEPFFSTKEEASGVGLGLAVVYGIVQRHGGTLEVESERGAGTTFHIRLPRHPAMEPEDDDTDGHDLPGGETT